MINSGSNQRHVTQLRGMANSDDSALRREVASIILDCCEEDLSNWFENLFAHGCVSGMVGPLIYYTDTHSFFDRHYSEIEGLREQYEADTGHALVIDGDLKNYLAWFAFEQVAHEISVDLS